jgi:hypothetical protein
MRKVQGIMDWAVLICLLAAMTIGSVAVVGCDAEDWHRNAETVESASEQAAGAAGAVAPFAGPYAPWVILGQTVLTAVAAVAAGIQKAVKDREKERAENAEITLDGAKSRLEGVARAASKAAEKTEGGGAALVEAADEEMVDDEVREAYAELIATGEIDK